MVDVKNLSTKVLAVLISTTVVIGVVGLVAVSLLNSNINKYNELIDGKIAIANELSGVNLNFKRQVQEWKNVLLRGSEQDDLDKYWAAFNARHDDIQQEIKLLLTMPLNDDIRRDILAFQRQHQALLPQYQKGLTAFIDSNYDAQLGDRSVRGIDRDPTKLLESVVERVQRLAASTSKELKSSSFVMSIIAVVLVIAAIVIAGVLAAEFLRRDVVNPLSQLINHLRAVSKGELNKSMILERSDEIGRMSRAIELVRSNLKETSDELITAQRDLETVADSLKRSADEINSGVSQQREDIEQVRLASNEMSASIEQLSQQSVDASQVASEVDNEAALSMKEMQATVEVIRDSSSKILNSSDVIAGLAENANNVDQVLTVINSIAEQTNLLALNAAIEAARAGEHGRGFAVVADEVRSLAAKTQQSIEEIQGIITTLQTGARDAVQSIESGKAATEQGVTKVLELDGRLQSMRDSVRRVDELNSEMSRSLLEQSQIASSIRLSMDGLTRVAENNASEASSCLEDNARLSQTKTIMGRLLQRLTGNKD